MIGVGGISGYMEVKMSLVRGSLPLWCLTILAGGCAQFYGPTIDSLEIHMASASHTDAPKTETLFRDVAATLSRGA